MKGGRRFLELDLESLAERIIWHVLQWRLFRPIQPSLIHMNCFLLKGKTKENLDLSVMVFAKYENTVQYLSELAFSGTPQFTFLGRVTHNKILSVINEHKPDLVLGDFAGIFSRFLSKSFLILPTTNFSLDISHSIEEINANMMRLRRRSMRKARDSSYIYEVTKNPETLESFYQDIYLPFTSKTAHDSFIRPVPFALMEKWFLSGELLLVKSNDKCLAGLLYHREHESTIHCRSIAYTEGLAAQAGLYRLIRTAKEDGYTRIDYGVAPPFMSDGLFFYKRSLGMEIGITGDDFLAVRLCNFEKPVQNFLINNPFVFTDFMSMIGLVTIDRSMKVADEVSLSSLCHNYHTRGLHKLLILYPQEYKEKFGALSSKDIHEMQLGALVSLTQLTHAANYELGILIFQHSPET